MAASKITVLLAALGTILANPLAKEGKSQQNALDYQIDPQLLNYHLQQLLQQEQPEQQSLPTQQVQSPRYSTREEQSEQYSTQVVQPQQYSYQAGQYSTQDGELQQQIQKQYRDQLQQQLQLQLQSQQNAQTAVHVPQGNSLTPTAYQQPLVQYQQPSLTQYQEQALQYQVASPQQYSQPAAQAQYQPQTYQQQTPVQQSAKQSLLGVAYSSAVDASKTHFSGYGIKYSF